MMQANEQNPLVEEASEHSCDDCSRYTFGPLGWGWYCDVCGDFTPMDEVEGE